jgi:hypothetical protein
VNQHNGDQRPHNQHETFHSVSPFPYSLGLRANPTGFETVTYGIATGLSATAVTNRAINEEFEPAWRPQIHVNRTASDVAKALMAA